MPRKKVNTSSLTNVLGASVLQWGIDNGFGDSTVSELHAVLANGKTAAPKQKATKKPAKKRKVALSAAAKKAAKKATKKAAPKQKAVSKKTAAPKQKATKQKTAKKTVVETAPRRSKGDMTSDPNAVVKFIKKHGSAKASDLKGLVPENANARSLFMGQLVEQNLIRREGKARGTTYHPA